MKSYHGGRDSYCATQLEAGGWGRRPVAAGGGLLAAAWGMGRHEGRYRRGGGGCLGGAALGAAPNNFKVTCYGDSCTCCDPDWQPQPGHGTGQQPRAPPATQRDIRQLQKFFRPVGAQIGQIVRVPATISECTKGCQQLLRATMTCQKRHLPRKAFAFSQRSMHSRAPCPQGAGPAAPAMLDLSRHVPDYTNIWNKNTAEQGAGRQKRCCGGGGHSQSEYL